MGSERKMPGSITPGNVQVCPPLLEYPQPACLKLSVTVLNCRHPIAILLESFGSIAIEGSFAASPTMFAPPETFTCVMKNREEENLNAGESFCCDLGTVM